MRQRGWYREQPVLPVPLCGTGFLCGIQSAARKGGVQWYRWYRDAVFSFAVTLRGPGAGPLHWTQAESLRYRCEGRKDAEDEYKRNREPIVERSPPGYRGRETRLYFRHDAARWRAVAGREHDGQ